MRLDQFLSKSARLSRKQAKIAIRGKRVTINGQLCKTVATAVEAKDSVTLDGTAVSLPGHRYLMLHKPAGYISATTDSDQPTALDLLPHDQRSDLHIAGRLDKDTTGLLLLTTDGQWSHRLTSPRSGCHKVYRLTTASPLGDRQVETLRQGVQLHGEKHPCHAESAEILGPQALRLTISEGKYHQVRRMLAAVGNRVETLHRERIGGLELDTGLAPGQWRPLTVEEVTGLAPVSD